MGTTTHLAAAMLFQQGALKLLHVPYKGNAPAIPDVVSGQVDVIGGGGGGHPEAVGCAAPLRASTSTSTSTSSTLRSEGAQRS